ncbi:MAG: hypothetical protein NVS2B5_10860 [Beijerinckiaceae bacterium]
MLKQETSDQSRQSKPPAVLSITHIFDSSKLCAEFYVGQSREAAPDDSISRWRIAGPGQIAAQPSEFGKIECEGSWATSSIAEIAHEPV